MGLVSDAKDLCYTNGDSGTHWQGPVELPQTEASQVLLFGGTFDPPHLGHLTMAILALEQTMADEVWFLPAPSPPHKADIADDTFLWRKRMVEALVKGRKGLRVVDIESRLARPSFSVDTVRACQAWYPDITFRFLLGTDSLSQLPSWHGAHILTRLISFVVAGRSLHPFVKTLEEAKEALPDLRAEGIEMPLLDISSSWLRDRLDASLDVCGLTPPEVLQLWHRGP
jgi:nicotinate-nucleotide adenylyltransferase